MKKNWLLFIALAACAINAQASFNGQVILAEYLFPDSATVLPGQFTPAQATVGAAVEFTSNNIAVDFSSNNILWTNIDPTGGNVDFAPPASFNGHQFTDANGTIPAITGVTINPATTIAGFDASRVSFDANSIRANFDSLTVTPDDIVSVDVTFAAAPPAPQEIPSVSALGLGLLGLLLGLIGIRANRSRARS
jgi:hypothetical protein